jgi:PKD repeat protein
MLSQLGRRRNNRNHSGALRGVLVVGLIAFCQLLYGCEALINVIAPGDVAPELPSSTEPVAKITVTPNTPDGIARVGIEVLFSASDSTDPVGDGLQYEWTIADSFQAYKSWDSTVTHKYWMSGIYVVTLRVKDTHEQTGFCSETITVESRVIKSGPHAELPIGDRLAFDWKVIPDTDMLGYVFSVVPTETELCTIAPQFVWSFSDSSSVVGDTIEKHFEGPGVYTITVTRSCGTSTEALSTRLAVRAFSSQIPSLQLDLTSPFLPNPEECDLLPTDEVITIANRGGESVLLDGWSVESSSGSYYWFPREFVLHPGETVSIHTGYGVDSDRDLHWRSSFPLWTDLHGSMVIRDPHGVVAFRIRY